MPLLPPSTNADYHGAPVAAWFLTLAAVATIIPGCIHYFLPDGGAGVIAGIDLSQGGATIIKVFAWFGALQIPWRIALLVVGWRYRSLVPLFLLLVIVERGLMTIDGWLLKGAGGHHPPEHFASPVTAIVAAACLVLALRPRRVALSPLENRS